MWLSLVEHYVRDVGAAGSNPVIPTMKKHNGVAVVLLKNNRGVAQVVAHLTGGQGAAGSSPVTPTTSERTLLRSDFSLQKNQSRAPSFLLFRKKSRSVRLLVCKRTHDGSQSLPTFHDIVHSVHTKTLEFTAFSHKSRKNTHTT